MTRGLNHVYTLHKMCKRELQILQENINCFNEHTDKILKMLEQNWDAINDGYEIPLITYDKFLTNVCNVMDSARKFNLQLEYNDLNKQAHNVLYQFQPQTTNRAIEQNDHTATENNKSNSIATVNNPSSTASATIKSTQTKATNTQQTTEHIYQQELEQLTPDSAAKEEDLSTDLSEGKNCEYFTKDLTQYKVDSVLNACITYVQENETTEFFICDANEIAAKLLLRQQDVVNYRKYTDRPPANKMFGLMLDNMVFRAVLLMKEKIPHAFLLDLGEVVPLKSDSITYELPPDLYATPAQATRCQLMAINDDYDFDNSTLFACLQKLLFQHCTFRILAVQEDLLQLSLQLHKSEEEEEMQKKTKNTNPFIDDSTIEEEEGEALIDNSTTTLQTEEQEAIPLAHVNQEQMNAINVFTEEDLEILNEEPLNTSNAMKAVMGYVPKDDERICRFYDPKTGACFKGANCEKEHTLPPPSAWTKDTQPAATIIDIRRPTIKYAHGQLLSITPTYVGQLDRFYAQINESPATMEPLIWNPSDVPQRNRLKAMPFLFEIILARYEDGLWYRAKVLEVDESSKQLKVLYVDYGNQQTIHIRNAARCEHAIAKIEFQAVLCRLAGVRDCNRGTSEQRHTGINMLRRVILNKTMNVKVISHYDELLIQFVEAEYAQLPTTLVQIGCMEPYKPIVPKV